MSHASPAPARLPAVTPRQLPPDVQRLIEVLARIELRRQARLRAERQAAAHAA